jgi:hypothetical protein
MDTNGPERVSGAREAEALAGGLFNECVGAGQPVIAWWYWLSDARFLPLPEPLDSVGHSNGPRRVRVSMDDRIEEI